MSSRDRRRTRRPRTSGNPRRRRRRTVVNKTRFTLFSLTTIIVLAAIFVKFFLPSMSISDNNASAGVRNSRNTKYVESFSDETNEVSEVSEVSQATEKPAENTEKRKSKYDFTMDSGQGPLTYYNQEDPKWAHQLYGPSDEIGSHGCGPAVMATIVNSLTDESYDPKNMSDWAYDHGYCAVGDGSYHTLIPEGAAAFGLNVEPMYHASVEDLEEALMAGKIVVMVSGHGVFSDEDGHFIIIKELKPNGMATISDSVKLEHVFMEWELEELVAESSNISSAGGPFWAIWK